MKKTILFAAAFLAAVSQAYAVQPITMDQDGIDQMLHGKRHSPAMDQLQGLADGTCSANDCFDGNPILRREPPVVILKEEFVRYQFPRHRHHGRGEGGDYTPGKYIYKQTVGIEDREKFVSEAKTGGRFAGGLIGGLLGMLGFLGGPVIGVAVLLGMGFAGYKVGEKKAAAEAQATPRIFERTMEYENKH